MLFHVIIFLENKYRNLDIKETIELLEYDILENTYTIVKNYN